MEKGVNFFLMMYFKNGSEERDKFSENFVFKQNSEPVFRSLANIEAVKTELKNELSIINNIILNAIKEVDSKRNESPYFFIDSRVYSAMLNASIKGKIVEEINKNPDFGSKVRYKSRYGSVYFILKGQYLIYIKKLNGNGKPNYVSTPRSNKIMNQLPFDGGTESIPILFVGPQFKGLIFEGTSITSLISKKEVNWNLTYEDLFRTFNYNSTDSNYSNSKELDNVRLKGKKSDRKSS